jgi:hypothetical protein
MFNLRELLPKKQVFNRILRFLSGAIEISFEFTAPARTYLPGVAAVNISNNASVCPWH